MLLSSTRRLGLALAALVAPVLSQDECGSAIVVGNGTNGPFANTAATTSAPAWPCGAGGNDLWFAHVATCTGTLAVDTCGAGFDTVLQLFDAGCGGCGALIAGPCNDDALLGPCSGSVQSRASMPVTSGVLYYIRVGGFASATGSFPLNLTCTIGGGGPLDDEPAGAALVTLGQNGPFANAGYTTSHPAWPCSPGRADRWFLFPAACTAPHTFSTCSAGTTFDTTIEVFAGAPPCALVSLGCNDDAITGACAGSQVSSVTVGLNSGTLYWLRVGGFGGATGSFDLIASTGTNSGTSALGVTSTCASGRTMAVTGNLNIGGTLVMTLNGFTGAPVVAYGFPPSATLGCGCSIITDGLGGLPFFAIAASQTLPIPCIPALIGIVATVQGFDVLPALPGPCNLVGIPLYATDIYTVTVG